MTQSDFMSEGQAAVDALFGDGIEFSSLYSDPDFIAFHLGSTKLPTDVDILLDTLGDAAVDEEIGVVAFATITAQAGNANLLGNEEFQLNLSSNFFSLWLRW